MFSCPDVGLSHPQDFAGGTDFSFLVRTGRVIRMARLVRYANSLRLRRRAALRKQEMLKLVDQVANGSIDDEEAVVEKVKASKPRQRSRLGTILWESITRKVIVLILVFFSLVPQLVYTEENRIESAAARSLHKYSSPADGLEVMAERHLLDMT